MVNARRFVTVLSLVSVIALSTAGAATAGKSADRNGRRGGTLTLVLLESTDGQAHYGQNGVLVYTHSAGFYPGYPWPSAQTFHLASTAWTGGAADCTAKLYKSDRHGGFVTLTKISFYVLA
jgi:hypothetical protein